MTPERRLEFNDEDPYPLFNDGVIPYALAQEHAQKVDEWLGLDAGPIERELLARRTDTPVDGKKPQHWIGLPLQTLQTPYIELRSMLARLAPQAGQTLVDLGAGYGRLGLILARHFGGVRFVGYECVLERVLEGQRCLDRQRVGAMIELKHEDLARADFSPVDADYYFLYDYGTREAIAKTLEDLKTIGRRQKLIVVGRGRASRDAIEREHPWLSQIHAPEHHGNYSIYRS